MVSSVGLAWELVYDLSAVGSSHQPRNPASRVHSCSWFLQSVVEGEINLLLAFFSDKRVVSHAGIHKYTK
jgi:hypothetical protein